MYFTFNGISSESFGLRVKSKLRPILPDVRRKYVEVAGRDGSYDFSDNTIEDRMIDVECSFFTNNVSELRLNLRNMAKWLFNGGKSARLVFSDEPDLYYDAKVNNKIDFEQTASMGEFTINFRCKPTAFAVDPVYTNQAGVVLANELDASTLLLRDLQLADTFFYSNIANDTNLTINNYGTYKVAPVLYIVNPTRNNLEISLKNQAGAKIAIFEIKNTTPQWPTGVTTLMIDMENFTCVRPNGENMLQLTTGKWWELESGNNTIYVNGFSGQGSLGIGFNARFL